MWGALLYGGRLVVVPVRGQPVARGRSTSCWCASGSRCSTRRPSAFRQLIQADVAERARCRTCALRYVIFGGEALELRRLRPWFERTATTRPRLVNMYGITETTVHVTYRPIDAAPTSSAGAGSVIGVPIPDLRDLRARRATASRCRSACPARSTSAAPAWRGAISTGPS